MDLLALERAIEEDRAAGLHPFLVVATAGTVNSGPSIASKPLPISPVSVASGFPSTVRSALWLFSDELRAKFRGIERSSSLALDFHKWGHVPYDAGFLLVRERELHRQAFAQDVAYLQRTNRGLTKGETWPCDLGPDLSRGSRALKTGMTLRVLGTDAIGRSIAHTCILARYLGERLAGLNEIELKAPVDLNIVCFGIRGMGADDLKRLVLDLHEQGLAAPSWTMIDGELTIRCAIVNHRTTRKDIDVFAGLLSQRILRLGAT
ncbi:glutamate/tyrosine decarboxylase-like PLP-dependent enzyme [Rhizobium sp. BK529]|nr:glutamate/tyrosine decarboxylase-like PLP-dependent enzyme [Rhizobium sp. BK529]